MCITVFFDSEQNRFICSFNKTFIVKFHKNFKNTYIKKIMASYTIYPIFNCVHQDPGFGIRTRIHKVAEKDQVWIQIRINNIDL